MNTDKPVIASFIAVLALIIYRDFRNPDSSWPLGPVPPPYRFTYAGVIFGILMLVADMWSTKIAGVVAIGVVIGTMYSVVSGQSATAGLKSNAPAEAAGKIAGNLIGKTASANPNANNTGTTGSTAIQA